MNKNTVTMVHPKQIVSKKLKGCNTTRTVTSFAQKYDVPRVWWSPTRNQKVLLVDWPQFKSTWKEVKGTKTTTACTPKTTTYGNYATYSKMTAKGQTPTKNPTRTSFGKTANKNFMKTTAPRSYKRTPKVA